MSDLLNTSIPADSGTSPADGPAVTIIPAKPAHGVRGPEKPATRIVAKPAKPAAKAMTRLEIAAAFAAEAKALAARKEAALAAVKAQPRNAKVSEAVIGIVLRNPRVRGDALHALVIKVLGKSAKKSSTVTMRTDTLIRLRLASEAGFLNDKGKAWLKAALGS